MADRNAARVLPEPVGAAINVCSWAWMAGHARFWISVGDSKVASNHLRVAGWNWWRGIFSYSRPCRANLGKMRECYFGETRLK